MISRTEMFSDDSGPLPASLETASKQECRARVQATNLDGPRHKLVVEKGWPLEKADEAEGGYRLFLYMNALYPGEGFVPTKLVDAFWHEHILDTAAYAADCERIFGRFFHHFPYFGLRGEEDARQLSSAFTETNRRFLAELKHSAHDTST